MKFPVCVRRCLAARGAVGRRPRAAFRLSALGVLVWATLLSAPASARNPADPPGAGPAASGGDHLILRYPMPGVQAVAERYRAEGMRWFYTHHTPQLLTPLLDSTLVPLIEYPSGWHRNPAMTSQAALAFYNGYLDTGSLEYLDVFLANVDWLAAHHDEGYLRYDFAWGHVDKQLDAGWVSAMAQGEALAAVSSAYHLTGDPKYLDAATAFFKTLQTNTEDSWTFVVDDSGYYWLEEYPNPDRCHVLNGMLFGLWGLWEYYVITEDPAALDLFLAGVRTIADHYPIWNVAGKNASKYCLHNQENPVYHEIHLRQLNDYLKVFDIPEFAAAAAAFSAHPVITASHETLDFGSVAVGASSEIVVTVGNDGTAPLVIESIAAEKEEYDVQDRRAVIEPAQSLDVAVAFAPSGTGLTVSTLRISSSDGLLAIGLSGSGVEAAISTESDEIAFGDLSALATDTLWFRLTNPTSAAIPLESVATRTGVFVVPDAEYAVEPGRGTRIPLVFAPRLVGTYEDSVIVRFPTAGRRLAIAVSGRAVSPLQIVSSTGGLSLDFDDVPVGRSDTLEALIRNTGLAPVAVSEIRSPRDDVAIHGAPTVVDGKKEQRFRLIFTPQENGGFADSLLVVTNISTEPLRVPISARATTNVAVDDSGTPADVFAFDPVYPNPTDGSALVRYHLYEPVHVRITLYNALGQVVDVPFDGHRPAGDYTLDLQIAELPGGLYFCRFEAGSFIRTREVVRM